jgi:hypothetical protein
MRHSIGQPANTLRLGSGTALHASHYRIFQINRHPAPSVPRRFGRRGKSVEQFIPHLPEASATMLRFLDFAPTGHDKSTRGNALVDTGDHHFPPP